MAERVRALDRRDRRDPASVLSAQLAAIETQLREIKQLAELRERREEERYAQIRPLIGPALGLESFLVQLHEVCRTQNQGFMALTDAIRLWLAHIDASDRAAEQERAAGVG